TTKNTKPIIWMHSASLGEFEQGLPLLQQIKLSYPNYAIVVSFFSPSGYEVRKNHPIADLVCYLPMDSKTNAAAWLKILKPDLVIFVKY
ncbi:glycosyltransferase N-terminal domain-containing protein, partial [Acinetobacter baumannii]